MSSPGREREQNGKWKEGRRTDISKKRKIEVFQWKGCKCEWQSETNIWKPAADSYFNFSWLVSAYGISLKAL